MTPWPSIIADLQQHLRLIDIADRVGMTESSISQLKRKLISEPRHSVGQALLSLHAEYCVLRETPDEHAEN